MRSVAGLPLRSLCREFALKYCSPAEATFSSTNASYRVLHCTLQGCNIIRCQCPSLCPLPLHVLGTTVPPWLPQCTSEDWTKAHSEQKCGAQLTATSHFTCAMPAVDKEATGVERGLEFLGRGCSASQALQEQDRAGHAQRAHTEGHSTTRLVGC